MDAKAACEAGGSELARVGSQAQQDCLVDMLSSVSFSLNWMSMNGQTDLNGIKLLFLRWEAEGLLC